MATRFCMTCGTEVDEEATFCPACGNPMDAPPRGEIPAAPAWPRAEVAEPSEVAEVDAASDEADDDDAASPAAAVEADPVAEPDRESPHVADPTSAAPLPTPLPGPRPEPTRVTNLTRRQEPPDGYTPPPARASAAPPREPDGSPPPESAGRGALDRASQLDLPVTLPVTLSGWLIGVGSFVGALAVLLDFRAFTNPVTLIAFLLLLAVAAVIFFSANVPAIPHRELWILVVVLVAFGAALERIGSGTAFAGAIFFLATGAAAVGAIILELGLDRPFGGGTSG